MVNVQAMPRGGGGCHWRNGEAALGCPGGAGLLSLATVSREEHLRPRTSVQGVLGLPVIVS